MLKTVKWIALLCIVAFAGVFSNFYLGVMRVESEWLGDIEKETNVIQDIGSTQRLTITPLINWHTSSESLKTEAGVSYLIETDDTTILFDVGYNKDWESPSPLEFNMNQLGIRLDDIDAVFISHAHLDHNGGQTWVNRGTFSLGVEPPDLSTKKLYAPVPMTYPGTPVQLIKEPTVIAKGVASFGAISRQLFIGHIEEQGLVIHVENLGLIAIVGCGHQTVPKILTRINSAFSQPLYGLVGDLHYPVPEGRIVKLGLNMQRLLASGDGPLQPITWQSMEKDIALLKRSGLKMIALGGHDTSDDAIERFAGAFGKGYAHVRVGEPITITHDESTQ